MQLWLIIGVVLIYFYTVSCVFFTVQIAALKGRRRGWGWLGLFLGLVGLLLVCFLPNAKGVEGETNPVRASLRRLREISPVASWFVAMGLVVVIGGALMGTRLVTYFENRSHAKELSVSESGSEAVVSPSVVTGKVASLFAGNGSNYAVTESGDLYGWGAVTQFTPQDVSGKLYEKVRKVQVVGDTCFLLTADRVLYAKGDNSQGLIPGQSAAYVNDFAVIQRDVADFSASETAAALLKESGNLYIWGSNTYGQLGRGVEKVTDIETRTAAGVTKVIVTARSVYYRTGNGDVFAIGSNAYGQFGLGNKEVQYTPVKIGSGCKDFAAGTDFTLLLGIDGQVLSAGNASSGQLGRETGEEAGPGAFAPVEGLEAVESVYAGGRTAFAKTGGNLYAWGENTLGQLGTGDRKDRSAPEQVHSKAAAISVGGGTTLLLTESGKLLGAGDRRHDQLGARESGDGFREIADVKEG